MGEGIQWQPPRTRPSSSRKVGSPERSVRSTRVLTKNPTRSSSSAFCTAGDGGTNWDIVAGSQTGQQGRETSLKDHEQGRPAGVGHFQQASVQAGPRCTGTVAPRWLATGRRGRSKGSLSSSGAPARACRENAS